MKKMDAIDKARLSIEDLTHWLSHAEDDVEPWFTETFWELGKIKNRIKKYREYLEAENEPDAYAA